MLRAIINLVLMILTEIAVGAQFWTLWLLQDIGERLLGWQLLMCFTVFLAVGITLGLVLGAYGVALSVRKIKEIKNETAADNLFTSSTVSGMALANGEKEGKYSFAELFPKNQKLSRDSHELKRQLQDFTNRYPLLTRYIRNPLILNK